MSVRDKFERTKCSCRACCAGCHTMPGMLAVGDLERIAEATGNEWDDADWVESHFSASYGTKIARVRIRDGHVELVVVPTITPQQRPDGSCVFLDEAGRCSIHGQSPYGCSHFDTHLGIEECSARMHAAISEIMDDGPSGSYFGVIRWLSNAGRTARPIEERRTAYAEFERSEAERAATLA